MLMELLELKVYVYCASAVRKIKKAWEPLQDIPKMK